MGVRTLWEAICRWRVWVIQRSLTRKIVTTDTGGTFLHRQWINAFSFDKWWMDSGHFELISNVSRRRRSPTEYEATPRARRGRNFGSGLFLFNRVILQNRPPVRAGAQLPSDWVPVFFLQREPQPTRSFGRELVLSGVNWVFRA